MKHQMFFVMLLGASAIGLAQGPNAADPAASSTTASTAAYSSSASADASATADAPAPSKPQDSTASTGTVKKNSAVPVGSLTLSYVYLFQTSPSEPNRSMMGFSAMPEVNFTRHLGFQGDFTSLYVRSVPYNQRRLILAAGPRYTIFRHDRFSPFVYGEGGEMRSISSQNNVVDWNPVAKAGVGVDMKLTRGISFQLIPGEYQGERLDWNSQWNHSFSARAGITFNLYK